MSVHREEKHNTVAAITEAAWNNVRATIVLIVRRLRYGFGISDSLTPTNLSKRKHENLIPRTTEDRSSPLRDSRIIWNKLPTEVGTKWKRLREKNFFGATSERNVWSRRRSAWILHRGTTERRPQNGGSYWLAGNKSVWRDETRKSERAKGTEATP